MMKKSLIGVVVVLGLTAAVGVGWSLQGETPNQRPVLKVFKSATCGCCGDWVRHMKRVGFDVDADNVSNMAGVKAEYDIGTRLQSCHTAISEDGYFFEGHVPGKVIEAFLGNPPQGARGLAAPGMPMGSPGMEMGRFSPFDVLLVRNDGSTSVYQRIDSPDYE